ncbi:hypothetical protein CK203_076878 [Vitis vinifera]|uniref:Uncharacterized protein n=1 Tax=Vitis vinifera TaxID=29760 RepID=A0A438ESS1_VITVI|nr:hypothetical protein CK203_076878 [Vitis vinifera]
MIWASRNRILVSFYALSNTIGFFVSLDMILVLTSKFPMCWGLVVAVHAIAVNYTISIVGITPSGGMKIASAVLCITLLLAIRLTSRCIRTRSSVLYAASVHQRADTPKMTSWEWFYLFKSKITFRTPVSCSSCWGGAINNDRNPYTAMAY